MEGLAGPNAVPIRILRVAVFFFSRSGTTADGSRQQQHKIGKMRAADGSKAATDGSDEEWSTTIPGGLPPGLGGATHAEARQQQQQKSAAATAAAARAAPGKRD
jgi:hypothetical protein